MDVQEEKQSRGSYFEIIRQLVAYSSLTDDRKEYFYKLVTEARFDQMSEEEAEELMKVLPEAQEKLEKMVIESEDPEKIRNLAAIKDFTSEILNQSEEEILKQVLDAAGDKTEIDEVPAKSKGSWLLSKLAGLTG